MIQNQMGQIKHIHDNNEFKSLLARKLIDGNKFWSYDKDSVRLNISDEDIIENTLIYLDIEDINILFRIIFPFTIKINYPTTISKYIWNIN